MASVIAAGTTAGTAIAFSGDTSGALQLQTNGTTTAVTLDTSQNATFAGKVTSAGALTLASNGTTTAVTIDTSQNVGIGGTPNYKLNILSADAVGTTNTIAGSQFALEETSRSHGIYMRTTGGTGVGVSGQLFTNQIFGFGGNATELNSNSITVFGISGTERMRIDSSGNVTAGGTTSYGKITSAASSGYCFGTDSVGNGADHFRFTSGGGTTTGSITRVGGTGVAYNVTSDRRLKENIQDADSASALVAALQVRKFDWKADNSHQKFGFVAQELAIIAPEAVHQPSDPEEMMAVDYSKLVPMLVKAIQEQQALIVQLQADVAALKGVKA